MKSFKEQVGQANLLLVTLDTLRFDAAQHAWRDGRLKTLSPYMNSTGWQLRHSPASFTYAAHHAFFSGFLPTPASNGPHPRLFASAFSGSESVTESTFVFPQATLPQALSDSGYRTLCVGGTGFFNLQNEIGSVLPRLFEQRVWHEDLGVSCAQSPENQCQTASNWITRQGRNPLFAFINCSAIHQPNWFYGGTPGRDTLQTHTSALVAFDQALEQVLAALRESGQPCLCVFCSDHGTAYGEDGYQGHRLGHAVVWNVPYLEFWL